MPLQSCHDALPADAGRSLLAAMHSATQPARAQAHTSTTHGQVLDCPQHRRIFIRPVTVHLGTAVFVATRLVRPG